MKVRGRSSDVAPDAYTASVLRAIGERVQALVVTWEQTATPAPPEDELVNAVLGVPPLARVSSKLADEIGPFYDTSGVMALLGGVTKQAVNARRKKGTILALRTADAKWVYPVFQFAGNEVDRALLAAIRALGNSPAWSAALWFVTSNDDLAGMTPLNWAKAGLPTDALDVSAHRTASEWV